MKYLKQQPQNGYIMIIVLLNGLVLFTIMAAIAASAVANFSAAKRSLDSTDALSVAEAGIDNTLFNINQDNSYSGTNTACPISSTGSNPVTLFNDSVKGKGTYETCVTTGSISNEKIVYGVGKIYLPQTASTPVETKTVRAIIEGTPSGGYAVETGPGGLIMSNTATIPQGNVYIGGYLQMSNQAQIGSVATPATVNVADYQCPKPANATFPVLCGAGTQPISISNQAKIYGSVSANNQTDGSGMTNPGLVSTSGVANVTLPNYDRAAQKAAVSSSMTAGSASCSGNQTRTWPANVHITGGDVSVSNNCVVTVQGNVWIDGNLSLANKGVLQADASLTQTANIMIDGSTGLSMGNQSTPAANASGVAFQFITFWSAAPCSPDCSNVTGTDLYNSQLHPTITLGNQGLGPSSTFYARWSELTLNNSGNIGTVLGQTINLGNTGNITFGSVGAGSTMSWDIRYYEQL